MPSGVGAEMLVYWSVQTVGGQMSGKKRNEPRQHCSDLLLRIEQSKPLVSSSAQA